MNTDYCIYAQVDHFKQTVEFWVLVLHHYILYIYKGRLLLFCLVLMELGTLSNPCPCVPLVSDRNPSLRQGPSQPDPACFNHKGEERGKWLDIWVPNKLYIELRHKNHINHYIFKKQPCLGFQVWRLVRSCGANIHEIFSRQSCGGRGL